MARTRGEKNGWFVGAVGVALLVASGCLTLRCQWIVRSSVSTDGTVVANRKEQIQVKGGEQVSYVPTVEFFDPQGNAHRIEPSSGTREATPIGAKIPVLYPPGEPGNARVGGPFLWTWPIGFAGLGLFFLAFGGLLIVLSRWLVRRGVPMRW